MPYEINMTGDKCQLVLAGRLGVQQASLLWSSLQSAADESVSIELLADRLEEIDTSIVQILCRLSRWPAGFEVVSGSASFRQALECRGLAGLLQGS